MAIRLGRWVVEGEIFNTRRNQIHGWIQCAGPGIESNDDANQHQVIRVDLTGNPRVQRLFAHPKEVEGNYFERTGIFPIMHTVVVRNHVLEQFPWVAASMLRAFRESKSDCYRRLTDPRQTALAWVQDLIEEQRSILGPDPWPYALEPNRVGLEALIRYSHAQGMIPTAPAVEDLFVESTLRESPRYVS